VVEKDSKKEIKKEIKKETEPAVKIMTSEERRRLLIEGIKKTLFPAFISAAFAVLYKWYFGTAEKIPGKPWYFFILLTVFISYYIQRFLYPYIGVRVKEFETKDWLYVEFLTVIYLLVFWILLLN